MKTGQAFFVLATTVVAALNMEGFSPEKGVQPEFRTFYEALVGQADNATATTSFTDFFTADGHQTTLTLDCVGPEKILRCKQGFLPPDGSKTLTHFPGKAFIFSNDANATVYEVQGRIEHNFVKGNCSQNLQNSLHDPQDRPARRGCAEPEPQAAAPGHVVPRLLHRPAVCAQRRPLREPQGQGKGKGMSVLPEPVGMWRGKKIKVPVLPITTIDIEMQAKRVNDQSL
ncbi:hypothetical protein RB595_008749 [Gaeumannomyces hyphopodioides]